MCYSSINVIYFTVKPTSYIICCQYVHIITGYFSLLKPFWFSFVAVNFSCVKWTRAAVQVDVRAGKSFELGRGGSQTNCCTDYVMCWRIWHRNCVMVPDWYCCCITDASCVVSGAGYVTVGRPSVPFVRPMDSSSGGRQFAAKQPCRQEISIDSCRCRLSHKWG